MRHHERLHKVALAIGHGGYIIGLLEYGVTDILWLRVWAIVGCGMVVGYQLLQPRVQWLTAGWCGIYVAVNVVQVVALLGAAPPPLSWEEAKLQEMHARHITPAELHPLLQLGEWLWLVDGALVAEQGGRPEERRLTLITEGRCEVFVDGQVVGELGAGSAVGEIGLLRALRGGADGAPAAAGGGASVLARGSVRCFSAPAARVEALLQARPELRAPLERLFEAVLADKAAAMRARLQVDSYRAVLEVACSVDDRAGVAAAVEEVRIRWGVPAERHRALMDEVPQCTHRPFLAAAAAAAPPLARVGEGADGLR